MQKVNLTVGAFSMPFDTFVLKVPFTEGFVEEDDQVVPKLKSLKGFAVIFFAAWTFDTSLDTRKAPGHFTSVISEENFYISSLRNLNTDNSAIISSLTSVVTVIPLLLAVLGILIVELVAVKHLKIEALLTAIFRSVGISFYQELSHTSSCLCLIQMLILMFPVFIFNSAFSTQTIVGTADYKIDTWRDVINQGKIPFFIEGISMHDYFKAKVTKDYADNYERAVAEGFEEPFPLGPIPVLKRRELMLTFVSGVGKKLGPLAASSSDLLKPNQEPYFSAKPFHRSLQAMLFSYNASGSPRKRIHTLLRRTLQSGIATKMKEDIYVDFILSFYPATLYDFHKSEVPRKVIDLSWHSLNYSAFYQILHPLILTLILSTVVLFIELIIAFFTPFK
uniref:Uncharacterized protein n=1 Tax=Tetranychus urticae TaxID=32264 RepID=T1KMD2_TETUR